MQVTTKTYLWLILLWSEFHTVGRSKLPTLYIMRRKSSFVNNEFVRWIPRVRPTRGLHKLRAVQYLSTSIRTKHKLVHLKFRYLAVLDVPYVAIHVLSPLKSFYVNICGFCKCLSDRRFSAMRLWRKCEIGRQGHGRTRRMSSIDSQARDRITMESGDWNIDNWHIQRKCLNHLLRTSKDCNDVTNQ